MAKRLLFICKHEGVNISDSCVEALIDVSEGDMRKSITMLQSARRLLDKNEKLDVHHVVEVAGLIPDDWIQLIWRACKANSFSHVQDVANKIIKEGFPVDQVLNQLSPLIISSAELNDVHKAKIAIRFAEADKKLVDGADEYLQLVDTLSVITTVMLE
jgi:replication factor C subunit 2/4